MFPNNAPGTNQTGRRQRSKAVTMRVTDTPTQPSLAFFPISMFGMSMGLFGFALAVKAAGASMVSWVICGAGVVITLGLFAALLAKAVRHWTALKLDWEHPIRLAFFPATTISLLLLAMILHQSKPGLANMIWLVGAFGHAGLTLAVMSTWIAARAFGPAQLGPAWFIPAVGNVVAPLAGPALGHVELSWYFFSVGLVFWIVLLTLVFNRLIFHDPMPEKLRPTLVILVAPPSVAFLSWLQLNGGQVDALARVLINVGYFFGALVLLQMPQILRLPFSLSFWALSFPLAALTTASFRFADLTGSGGHQLLGWVLLALLTVTIAALAYRTGQAARNRQICLPE